MVVTLRVVRAVYPSVIARRIVLPVAGSLSLPCPSLGRRLERLGFVLIGCLRLGLAPCWLLLRIQHARRHLPSRVRPLRVRTPSLTYCCLRSPSGIAPYSAPLLPCSSAGFRDARSFTSL